MSTQFTDVVGRVVGERLNFNCPRCGELHSWSIPQLANVRDESVADYCAKCGQGFRVAISMIAANTSASADSSSPVATSTQVIGEKSVPSVPTSGRATAVHPAPPSQTVVALKRRYADAYIVARTVDGFGLTIKILGIVIGAVVVLLSFAAASKGGVGVLFALIGVAVAGTIAAILYILGTLASAQGQILKATLDSAVNTSRMLSDHDRAEIMSLPDVPQQTHAAPSYHFGTASS